MQDTQFFKKKQLLAQRDQLLEEMGQGVFKEGKLPPEFTNLPKEFKGMDIILRKLKERLRIFREQRDGALQDLRAVQDEMLRVEKAYQKRIEPCKQSCEERALKLAHKRDKPGSVETDSGTDLEEDLRCKQEELDSMVAAHNKEWAQLIERSEPLERSIFRLERAMLEVQKEMEGLADARAKRLRDLGYWFHHRKPNRRADDPEYTRLKLLRLELTEFKQLSENHTPIPVPHQLPTRKEAEKWRMPLGLLLAAAFLGYVFRTDFSQADLALADLAHDFMTPQVGYRVFADLTTTDARALEKVMPDLEALPGGAGTFRNMKTEDILQFVELRGAEGPGNLICFGVRFRRPPPRFALRLNNAGWRYHAAVRNWKALTDGDWVWVVVNERAFLLMPQDQVAGFSAMVASGRKADLLLDLPMKPLGNSHPLMQGFDRFHLTQTGKQFQLRFTSSTPLVDQPLRRAWLDQWKPEAREPITIALDEQQCRISGPRTFLEGIPLSGRELAGRVRGHLREPDTRPPYPTSLTGPGSGSGHSHRLAILDGGPTPEVQADLPLPGTVEDLAFHNPTGALLVLSDDGVTRYLRTPTALAFDCVLEHEAIAPQFRPTRLLPTPDERFAVLLERKSAERPRPRMALISLEPLAWLSVEPLNPRAENWQSAAWDKTGDTLYFACAAASPRAGTRQVVVTYRRDAGMMLLQNAGDLAAGPTDIGLPDLVVHPTQPHLYLTAWPGESLLRRDLGNSVGGILKLDLRQNTAAPGVPRVAGNGLALNRNGTRAVVIAGLDHAEGSRTRGVHLIDITGARMTPVDTLDPGFSASGLWRRPLSDRFWVLGSQDAAVHVLDIEEGRLHGQSLTWLESIQPRFICADRFGKTVYIAGPVRR